MRLYSAHNSSHSLMAFYNSSVGWVRPPHRGRPLTLFVVWTREIPLWCTVTFQLRQPGFNQYLIKVIRNFDCRWKFWISSRFFFSATISQNLKCQPLLLFCNAPHENSVTFPWKIPECPDSRQNPQIHLESCFFSESCPVRVVTPRSLYSMWHGFWTVHRPNNSTT